MYQPKPKDVIKYTSLDGGWYIVLVHDVRNDSLEEPELFEYLIEDIATSDPYDFIPDLTWVDGIADPAYVSSVELLMADCPDFDTFCNLYPEHLI